jgi:hypothetical protein
LTFLVVHRRSLLFTVKRYVRAVYAPVVGVPWSNQELLNAIQASLEQWLAQEERKALLDLIRLFLIGHRTRFVQCPDFLTFNSFAQHAEAFERVAGDSLRAVAAEVATNGPTQFDAILAVSSAGLSMPGLADRAANIVGDRVSRHALLLDLANAGCTGSSRALQFGATLGSEIRDILVVRSSDRIGKAYVLLVTEQPVSGSLPNRVTAQRN